MVGTCWSIEGGDDIATDQDILSIDRHRFGPGLQTGLVGQAARLDLLDQHTLLILGQIHFLGDGRGYIKPRNSKTNAAGLGGGIRIVIGFAWLRSWAEGRAARVTSRDSALPSRRMVRVTF